MTSTHSTINTDKLRDTLKTSGFSLTTPRQIVFRGLIDGPISQSQLAGEVKSYIDRATVYRTLDLFERLGITNKFYSRDQQLVELSEIFTPHHHHASCQRCHKIIDISSTEVEQALSHLSKRYDFLSVDHSVELRGYCRDCH